MTSTTPRTGAPRTGMFRELLGIHAILRRDLRIVQRLAEAVRDGLPADRIIAGVRDLQTNSPLWQLKFGCLYYCRFVHTHHTIEDAAVFPMVRKQDPSLNRMVDRLEEDHLTVHHITERIAKSAEKLASEESDEIRDELVGQLHELEEQLLAHLALEEETLGPLLSSWDRWPSEQSE